MDDYRKIGDYQTNDRKVGDYEVNDKGIWRVAEIGDYGNYTIVSIMPKETFIEAYNKYIKLINEQKADKKCIYSSDDEVKQPCIEGPCEHEKNIPDDITNKEAISELEWLVDSYKNLMKNDRNFYNSCIKIQKACELSIRALELCEFLGFLNSENEVDDDEE